MVGALDYFADHPINEVLQKMRITKSDKIEPAGYCVAVSHDIDDLELVNHAAKSDIMRVSYSLFTDTE